MALPIGLRGVVIAGVISIVMSSADSFLNAAAASCVNDLVNPFRRRQLSDRNGLLLAKLTNCVVGALAVVFAVKIRGVLDILIYTYNFWAPVILVPLAAVLLGIRVSKAAFFAGILAGAAGAIIWDAVLTSPKDIHGLVIGAICNLIAFTVANKLTGKSPNSTE